MCIQNTQKVKRTDRSKYKIAWKVIGNDDYPVVHRNRVSKPFHVDGKWNIVKGASKEYPNSAGFHLFLSKKNADKWWKLDATVKTYKCEIRGVFVYRGNGFI